MKLSFFLTFFFFVCLNRWLLGLGATQTCFKWNYYILSIVFSRWDQRLFYLFLKTHSVGWTHWISNEYHKGLVEITERNPMAPSQKTWWSWEYMQSYQLDLVFGTKDSPSPFSVGTWNGNSVRGIEGIRIHRCGQLLLICCLLPGGFGLELTSSWLRKSF